MTNQSFTTVVFVDQSPEAAYDAINNPRGWWGKDIEGQTDRLGEEWVYRYKDLHISRQKTSELVPGRRIVWDVVECQMSFLKDKGEWTGTKLVFDIARKGDKTEIRFTHQGLVPQVECFDICKNAWSGLVADSLKQLIETGKGLPDTVE